MTYFIGWFMVFIAFVTALVRNPRLFSEAHHFWYASTLYWMAATLVPPGLWRVALLTIFWLTMLDDGLEHTFGWSLVRWAYGKAGGTR